jgi:hypothetical protein
MSIDYVETIVDPKTATLEQHFDDTLRRVRTEFERTGSIQSVFEWYLRGPLRSTASATTISP